MGTKEQQEFEHYYNLPLGQYYTPEQAHATKDNGAIIGMWHRGRTNASSKRPILGTNGLVTCLGMGIYNKKRHEAYVCHSAYSHFEKDLSNLLSWARENAAQDHLEVHVIGTQAFMAHAEYAEPDRKVFGQFVEMLSHTPNIMVKTFDVIAKNRPLGFAIDARNGRLIMLTRIYQSDEKPLAEWPESAYNKGWLRAERDFDGMLPEHQSPQIIT